uniref:Ribosomal protein L27 n=1 Tax=Piridium sociabile TaxID=2570542 RepID=A0A5B9XXK2_9ALVE|nr:ribosomal protein L27 [Piridium sociabile]
MAQKKGAGSTKNGRDSNPKKLSLKISNNKYIWLGQIIITQKSNKFKYNKNFIKIGRNNTLYSIHKGYLFIKRKINININPEIKINLLNCMKNIYI